MKNYVLIYHFEDKEKEVDFLQELEAIYPDHRYENRHDIPYFAFAARELPGVEDNIDTILDEWDHEITDKDFIALYYIKDEAPDKIKRNMILGPDRLIENNLQKISKAEHENLIEDLFDLDFVKMRFKK